MTSRAGLNQPCQPRLSTLLSTLHTKYMGLHTKYMVPQHSTRAPGSPYKTYGLQRPQISHTFCMGRWGRSEGSHTKYMGLGSLIHFVWGFLSHTFCMGISLIHFVWGFCQLLELKRDTFNSVDLAQPYRLQYSYSTYMYCRRVFNFAGVLLEFPRNFLVYTYGCPTILEVE